MTADFALRQVDFHKYLRKIIFVYISHLSTILNTLSTFWLNLRPQWLLDYLLAVNMLIKEVDFLLVS